MCDWKVKVMLDSACKIKAGLVRVCLQNKKARLDVFFMNGRKL